MKYPTTIEEAREIKYSVWPSYSKEGQTYKEGKCAYGVYEFLRRRQCTRKNGYGPGGLYCKQHAEMVAKKQ